MLQKETNFFTFYELLYYLCTILPGFYVLLIALLTALRFLSELCVPVLRHFITKDLFADFFSSAWMQILKLKLKFDLQIFSCMTACACVTRVVVTICASIKYLHTVVYGRARFERKS